MSVIDVDNFNVLVDGFSPSPDGATFSYSITIRLDGETLTTEKRFSEFHALHNSLFARGFGALPQPPAKTLTRPNDPDIAEMRQHKLNAYIRELCARPDLRQSEPILKFLGLDLIPNPPKNLAITSITNTSDYRAFSVVDCSHNGDPNVPLYASAMADTTALSKLGRAWNVIEPEAVGALCIYNLVPNAETGIALGVTFSRQSQKRVCVTRFIRSANLNLLIAGDSSGLLSVYECKHTCVNTTELTPLSVREVHIKAPFVTLIQSSVDKFYFASIGGDQGLRFFRVDPNDCQVNICSSGRIKKPLAHPKETLTSLCLLEADLQHHRSSEVAVNTFGVPQGTTPDAPPFCRAVIGTNCGQILLYDVVNHPPECLGSLNLTGLLHRLENPFADEEPSNSFEEFKGPVAASLLSTGTEHPYKANPGTTITHIVLCRSGSDARLAVAINGYILILSLRPFLADDPEGEFVAFEQQFKKRVTKRSLKSPLGAMTGGAVSASEILLGVLPCPTEPAAKARITAMCWCEEYQLLFCSYQRGVTCWTIRGDLLQCLEMMRWGAVRKLEIQMVPYQGLCLPMLFCATSLGGLRMLDLVEAPNWRVWENVTDVQESEPTSELGAAGLDQSDSVYLDEIAANGPAQKELLRAEIYEAFRTARF